MIEAVIEASPEEVVSDTVETVEAIVEDVIESDPIEEVSQTVNEVTETLETYTEELSAEIDQSLDEIDVVDDLDAIDSILAEVETSLTQEVDEAINIIDSILPISGANQDPDSQDNSGEEESQETAWTETTILGEGGLFDDLANSDTSLGGGDALPDPGGTVAEGIGVLDIEPELDLSSIGGLFG